MRAISRIDGAANATSRRTDLLHLELPPADHLTDFRLDPLEAAQDEYRPLDSRRDPTVWPATRGAGQAAAAIPRRLTRTRTRGTARRQASAVSPRVGPNPRRSTSGAPARLPAPIDAAKRGGKA